MALLFANFPFLLGFHIYTPQPKLTAIPPSLLPKHSRNGVSTERCVRKYTSMLNKYTIFSSSHSYVLQTLRGCYNNLAGLHETFEAQQSYDTFRTEKRVHCSRHPRRRCLQRKRIASVHPTVKFFQRIAIRGQACECDWTHRQHPCTNLRYTSSI